MTGQPANERRARERSDDEARVTMLIQTILSHPRAALTLLERDLQGGGGVRAVKAVLDQAAAAATARGLDLAGSVTWIRDRLTRAGYNV